MIVETIIPVFLIILAGYLIGRCKKTDIQPFVDLVVYIAGPSLIFSSIARSNINITDFLAVALAASAIMLIMAFAVFIILKLKNSKKNGLYLPMTIGNTGFLGYPVALFALGADGLSRAVVYDTINSLILFSLGIYIVHRRNDLKEAFRIPLIYAVIAGLVFSFLKIAVPDIIFRPIEMIGMLTIPLALLILGYKLTEVKLSSAGIAFLASLFRIGGGFLAALLITNIFSITGLVRSIIILQAAMPSAVMSMILTQKYNKDAELAASVVFISTMMSILTIPLILWFL